MVASGGDLRAGLVGGVTAGMFYGVGELYGPGGQFAGMTGPERFASKVVLHGTVGGVSQDALGGQFKHGFLSAGFAEAATLGGVVRSIGGPTGAGQMAVAAIIGGTASSIGGGKFGNGAVTGAFGYAFNQAMHRYKLGPTRMCWSDQSGCTLGNALMATDPVSVPFTENPVEGRMAIGPFSDPIFHQVDRQNYTITNTTLEGHMFHPGQVMHSLTVDTGLSFSWSRGFHMREGIFLTTTGSGTNACLALCLNSATANYAAGKYLFRDTHKMAPRLMQQYLGE